MFDLDSLWIDINCPQCQYSISLQMIDARNENIIYCHNCKSSIQLKDENASVHKGVNDINNAFEKLNNTLKNFGK